MNQEKEPQTNSAEEAKPEDTVPAEPKPEENKEAPAETAAPAESETEDGGTAAKKKKKEGPSFFQSQKFKHGSTATAFTAGFIAVVVLLNVLVGVLSDKYPSVNLDVTKKGGNTLSTEALQMVDKVNIPVEVTICATKQACDNNSVSTSASTATDYTQVSRLFAKAAERNQKITLSYIDLDKNPAVAAQYKSDSLTTGDVIVKSQKRYRVLTVDDLFTAQTSSDYTSQTYLSNVDSALASALNSVVSESMPVAAFDTGHSEKMDTTGYKRLLRANSFETKDFNLLTDKIPDKTQLLVLGCPTTDLTDDELAKVEKFLSDKTTATDRSVIVACSAGQGDLTKLSTYLGEWGLSVKTDTAVAETDAQKYVNSPLNIFVNAQTTLSLGSSKSSYDNLLAPYSCPVTIKAQSVGSKTTYSLLKSNDTSSLYKTSGTTASTQTAAENIAALSQETLTVNGKNCLANLIVCGSTQMFSSDWVNTSVLSNGSYLVDLSRYATGTNNDSTKITTTQQELYAKDISITSNGIRLIGYGIFTLLIPLAVAIAGIIVYRKRRAL